MLEIHYENDGDVLNMPYRKYLQDGAYDLHANEKVSIPAKGYATVDTGIRIQIPMGHVGLVCSRSGLAADKGIFVLNAPGIIDSGYSGNVKVILGNLGDASYHVGHGMRIAQIMIMPLLDYYFNPGKVWGAERGDNGFGSTGLDPEF